MLEVWWAEPLAEPLGEQWRVHLAPLLGPAEVVRVVARLFAAEAQLHGHWNEPERAAKLRRRACELYVVVGVGDDPDDRRTFMALYQATKSDA